jgi:hypothetical protein
MHPIRFSFLLPIQRMRFSEGTGRITWHEIGKEPQRLRDRVSFVLVDELGNELTADQACALRRDEFPNRANLMSHRP